MSEFPVSKTCSRCEMPVLDTDARCPFCGRRQSGLPVTPERWLGRVMSCVLLIVIGFPAALIGIAALLDAPLNHTSFDIILSVAGGLLSLAIAGLTVRAVMAAWGD